MNPDATSGAEVVGAMNRAPTIYVRSPEGELAAWGFGEVGNAQGERDDLGPGVRRTADFVQERKGRLAEAVRSVQRAGEGLGAGHGSGGGM